MNNLVKYLGVIVVLLGTAGLAIPQLMGNQSDNMMMLISLSIIVFGIVLHVVISKIKP